VSEDQDPELYAYLQELRAVIVDTYTTLMQGMENDETSIPLTVKFAPSIIEYLK
jgi:hypothetical protein